MNTTFGIASRPASTRWADIRRGPAIDTVRSHIFKVANFNGRSVRSR